MAGSDRQNNQIRKCWDSYQPGEFFDELITHQYQPRALSYALISYLRNLNDDAFARRILETEQAIREMGITFRVYSEGQTIDRAWPFDLIPRVIAAREWDRTEAGLIQRIRALNLFIDDVYNEQRIVRDGVVPLEVIEQSKGFRPACRGTSPPHGVWANICGSDLVRDRDGQFYVLEDNLRVPSGVAYMLKNRKLTKRVLPEVFRLGSIQPISDYPTRLYAMLASLVPEKRKPVIALWTPGIYNSAYFEHAYLAQQAGLILLEGEDLVVSDDDIVYMRTVEGLQRVDVIYRRIDDDFMDPEVFRKDSMLGVPGMMRAWQAGKVAIANAPGCGVADDKVIYAYVPDMIRYYLGEEPSLNNVPTRLCRRAEDLEYVLDHLAELVVKPASESGGYGMLVGPHSSAEEIEQFRNKLLEDPENYIAQPTLALSVTPTVCGETIAPRHVDLRPFILSGKETYVTPGGLTRVALREGSLVVNSSQGGGSKDTWVIEDGILGGGR